MASVWEQDGTRMIAASVSDFTGVMGYCEYEAPMLLQKVEAAPSTAVLAGLESHKEQEDYEKEHIELVPVTAEQIQDSAQNVEFAREEVHTRMTSRLSIDGADAEVSLYGRTDKLLRQDGVLLVRDDKFPSRPESYSRLSAPYPNQLLQTWVYLCSEYSSGDDEWFEMGHQSKRWELHIRDRGNGNALVKSFGGAFGIDEEADLNRAVEKFARLMAGADSPEHHNRPAKCRACKFAGQCPESLAGA